MGTQLYHQRDLEALCSCSNHTCLGLDILIVSDSLACSVCNSLHQIKQQEEKEEGSSRNCRAVPTLLDRISSKVDLGANLVQDTTCQSLCMKFLCLFRSGLVAAHPQL